MSSHSDPLARSKAIGEDVESLVVDALPLEPSENGDDHHDAVSTAPIGWGEGAAAPFAVRFLDCMSVGRDELVEIKAVSRKQSNGPRDITGRFFLKGRDEGQHARLVDEGAYYALSVYEPIQNRDAREVLAVVFVPASSVGELVDGSWYDVDRREKTAARLGWADVLDRRVVESAVDRLDHDTESDDDLDERGNGSAGRHLFEVVALAADRLAGDSVGDAPEIGDVVDDVLEVTNATRADAERAVDTAKARGEVYQPEGGRLRSTGHLTAATDGGEGE